MSYSRINELTKAKSILAFLGLKFTSEIVATMEDKVGRRETIEWSEMQAFLDLVIRIQDYLILVVIDQAHW